MKAGTKYDNMTDKELKKLVLRTLKWLKKTECSWFKRR